MKKIIFFVIIFLGALISTFLSLLVTKQVYPRPTRETINLSHGYPLGVIEDTLSGSSQSIDGLILNPQHTYSISYDAFVFNLIIYTLVYFGLGIYLKFRFRVFGRERFLTPRCIFGTALPFVLGCFIFVMTGPFDVFGDFSFSGRSFTDSERLSSFFWVFLVVFGLFFVLHTVYTFIYRSLHKRH